MNTRSSALRAPSTARTAETLVSRYDWETLSAELNSYGCAVIEQLLTPEECRHEEPRGGRGEARAGSEEGLLCTRPLCGLTD